MFCYVKRDVPSHISTLHNDLRKPVKTFSPAKVNFSLTDSPLSYFTRPVTACYVTNRATFVPVKRYSNADSLRTVRYLAKHTILSAALVCNVIGTRKQEKKTEKT